MEKWQLLKELTSGYSSQTKASNKYWILLLLASILSLAKYSGQSESIPLPFGLGEVSQSDYYSFLLLMICTTTIAFASAWFQQLRTRNLIQRLIDKLSEDELFIEEIHIQDYFDSTSTQTFNRVAPIVQVLQGKQEFFTKTKSSDRKRNRLLHVLLYGILKILTVFIILVIPLSALNKNVNYFYSFSVVNSWGIPSFVYWLLISVSYLVFLVLIISEIKYYIKSSRRIMEK